MPAQTPVAELRKYAQEYRESAARSHGAEKAYKLQLAANCERSIREQEGRTTDALEAPCADCGNPAYVVAGNRPLCDHCAGRIR